MRRVRLPATALCCAALALLLPRQQGGAPQPPAGPAPAPFLYYWTEEMPEGQVIHSRGFLLELKEHIEKINEEVSISVYMEPLASAGVVLHWFGATPDAAGFERVMRVNSADPEVQRMLGGAIGVFVPGTHLSTILSPCPVREVGPAPAGRVQVLVTTARVKPARYPETRGRATELTSYLNEHYPEVSARLYTRMIGDVPTLVWLVRVASLSVWDDVSSRVLEDEAYGALYADTFEGVLDDGVHTSWLAPFL